MRHFLIPIAATILSAAGAATAAQLASPSGQGLDLIVLVDVSGSMYSRLLDRSQKEPAPSGSDPERIRWDAVKLMADLLTPDDRMLVQRFTDHSPPRYIDENSGNPVSYLDPEGDRPLRPDDDFPPRLVPLYGDERADLQRRIFSFNTTTDRLGLLDLGGTRLVHALQVAAKRIGTAASGRATHVVLLTDGNDNEYEEGKYRTDEELRAALGFFTGDAPGHDPIPIHTIGLGLFADAKKPSAKDIRGPGQPSSGGAVAAPGRDAEQLLLRIAALTKGNYYKADTNRDLIGIFFALIRDMKGAWSREIDFAPSRPGETHAVPSLAVHGIVSCGALVFETDVKTANPRCTAPPSKPMTRNWVGLAGAAAPQEAHYTGKNNGVYDYFYFGKTSGEETAKSPFADLPPSARLALSMHGGSLPQHLILMHRTQNPLFVMTRPEPGARFYRHQSLEVRVAMAESAFFRPEQFDLVASVVRAGQSTVAGTGAVLQEASLRPVEGAREFSGLLSLRKLPQSDAPIDYYTLKVTAKGKPEEGNSLAGLQLSLMPQVIAVENKLVLGEVAGIELTETQPQATLAVATGYPVLEGLTLAARFEPFRHNGRPLEIKEFLFTCGGEPIAGKGLTLTQGKGAITIGFPSTASLPQGGIVYEPGKVVISGGNQARMDPLEIEVRLRIALAKIGFEPRGVALEAKSSPVASPEARVVLTPATQAKTAVGELTAEIRRVSSPGEPPNVPVGEFGPRELWLQTPGSGPLDPAKRSQRISLRLGDPLVAYVHPQGAKETGKYPYRIVVAGPGADQTEAPLSVAVNPPVLEVREDALEVYADPGSIASGSFAVRLQGIGGKPEQIVLRPEAGRSTFLFESAEPKSSVRPLELALEGPTRSSPLVLPWPTAAGPSWGSLPLRIQVPKETSFGMYRVKAIASGNQITDRPLSIRLVVNSLLVESFSGPDLDGRSPWRPAEQVAMVQFLGHDMQKTLRIRTGLGQSLKSEDVQVLPLRPFADEKGDAMRLPRVVETAPEDGGRALRVRLRFPETPNAHVALPYQVSVKVESPKLKVRPFNVGFRVRFWNPDEFLAPEEE